MAIAKTPITPYKFPNLLWEIAQKQLTGVLHLARKQIEKRLVFHHGLPVHAESNLLHETLGRYLVEQGTITDAQAHQALITSAAENKKIGEVLVTMGFMQPLDLYNALRKNMLLKIADCFLWQEGEYSFQNDEEATKDLLALRLDPQRLILWGVETSYSAEELLGNQLVDAKLPYRIATNTIMTDIKDSSLTTGETRLLKLLENPLTIETLAQESKLPRDEVISKLYAFNILGLIQQTAAPLPARPAPERLNTPTVTPKKPSDNDAETQKLNQTVKDEIMPLFMRLMDLSYFELLGVTAGSSTAEIKKQFMQFAFKWSPQRFSAAALKEFTQQGEEVFLRGVLAYTTLVNHHLRSDYLQFLKLAAAKKAPAGAAIKTSLLDSEQQFKDGLKALLKRDYKQAIAFFEYARDLDTSRPHYAAYLWWSRYLQNPETVAAETEQQLRRLAIQHSKNAPVLHLYGKFLVDKKEFKEGVKQLKLAQKLLPNDPEISRALKQAEQRQLEKK